MFLRITNRRKDGKDHRYFSVVENRRLPGGKTAQRTVLYLGEINDRQQAAWRKTLEVFDEAEQRFTSMSLFPDDRDLPADAIDSIQVRLSGLELKRPRIFGNCWLACELWRQLGLDEFWQQRLPAGRETVSWEKVLQLLAVNRLLDPGSEFRVHRQWYINSAMDELLGTGFEVAEKDRLYRCPDRVLEHKQELFAYLKQKWADLFGADFEVLLYDLTSTYFEGEMEQNPKAQRGYSRDGRPDCVQLVIALVVTPDGFPLAYEVMNGNTADCSRLRAMRKSLPKRDPLLLRIGAAKKEAGRAFGFVKIQLPQKDQEVTRSTFTFHTDKAKLKAAEQRDGHYLLRSNLTGEDPAVLWTRYVQLTQIESVFRSLKTELGIRPIYHQLEHRADAHVLIAFLAYCLQVTLKNRLMIHAPGLTPASVFDKLSTIQMVEVWIPLLDGRWLVLPRHTQPEADVQAFQSSDWALSAVRFGDILFPNHPIKEAQNEKSRVFRKMLCSRRARAFPPAFLRHHGKASC